MKITKDIAPQKGYYQTEPINRPLTITNGQMGFYRNAQQERYLEIKSTGLHISTPSNRYVEIDIEIRNGINDWIKSSKYITDLLVFRNVYEDWAEYRIISRIQKALKEQHSNMSGRFVITEDKDKIVLAWDKI